MAFIPIPDTVRVDILQRFAGLRDVVNTLHYRMPDFMYSDMVNLTEAIRDTWIDEFAPYVTNQLALWGVRATDLRAEDGPVYGLTVTGAAGGKIEQPLPIHSALVITLYTGARGRSARGRIYLAGFTEDQWDGQTLGSDIITAMEDYVTRLRTDIAATGFTQVIASRYANGQPRQVGITRAVVSAIARSALMGVQKRRMDRP